MNQKIKSIPKLGDSGDDVLSVQAALLNRGFNPGTLDSDFGPKTKAAVKAFQKSIGLPGSGVLGPKTIEALGLELEVEKDEAGNYPPWYLEAKKHEGKKETDSKFQTFMNAFWIKIGLPNFKGLIGSPRAWCALFVFMAIGTAGYKTGKLNAAAISGDNLGQKIEWETQGIPRGAIVRINHGSNCKSSSGNHIGFADGDCAPQDIIEMAKGADGVWKLSNMPAKIKAGATLNLLGGNQNNMVKVSSFPVNDICSVTWPIDMPLPAKVTKSDHCSGAKTPGGESTR